MSKNEFSKELEALKVTLDALSDLEEDRRIFVLNTVTERLGLKGKTTFAGAGEGGSAGGSNGNGTKAGDGALTPKAFLKQKQPASVVEQIACLAYFLTHHRESQHFKTSELTKLNTEAAGQRISNPSLFARNAVSQNGYLAPAGGGKKQITSRGEALVEALPDRAKVKEELAKIPVRARKPRGKGKAKKESKA